MKITVITVGKKHDKDLVVAIDKYQKRLKKFCDFSWVYIPTSNIDNESSMIERQLKSDDYVILLDETGEQVDNNQLAEKLEFLQNSSIKQLVFIIGGAYGVNYSLMGRSNITVSFSKLVFPHQLMRLILVEQLYRSYSILAGTDYHHK